MRDPYDKHTRDFVPKEKTMKFIASFGYTTANSQKIRSETQLIEAKDLAAAKLAAHELGSKSYDWFKINSVKPV